jgi:AbrB family looped-hinge helix DNA binding protein
MQHITMSHKGQVVIPQKIREELGFKPGTKLRVTVSGSSVILSRDTSSGWRELAGIAEGTDLISAHSEEKQRELNADVRL